MHKTLPDPKSRARVSRIIGPVFRPEDMINLFLFARDRCDGRESVKDVGDFVAHHNERDKGIITDNVRDWAVTARFYMENLKPRGHGRLHKADTMPPYFKRYLRSVVTRIGPTLIRINLGMSQVEAQKVVKKIIADMTENPGGTLNLGKNLSPRDISVLEFVTSWMVVRPAFTADKLCSDFRETLRSNGLISREELRECASNLDVIIQLFAVSVMHNSRIILDDGHTIFLRAGVYEGIIRVFAEIPLCIEGADERVHVVTSMFSTNLPPEAHCDKSLLEMPRWDTEIELSSERMLTAMASRSE